MCLCLAVRGIPKHRLLEAWQFLSCSSFSLFFPDSVRTRAVPAWLIAPPDESGPLACLIRGNFNRFWWRVVVAGPSFVSDSGESAIRTPLIMFCVSDSGETDKQNAGYLSALADSPESDTQRGKTAKRHGGKTTSAPAPRNLAACRPRPHVRPSRIRPHGPTSVDRRTSYCRLHHQSSARNRNCGTCVLRLHVRTHTAYPYQCSS